MGMPLFDVKCQIGQIGIFGFQVFNFHTNYHELTMNSWRGVIFLRVIVFTD
jgi:hypothetical protein